MYSILFYSILFVLHEAPAACTLQYTYIIIYMYYRDILADKIETLQRNRHKS